MGSSHSQEAPRPAPRKLAKPQVGHRDRSSNAASAVQNPAVRNIKAAQFSNSYLVGAAPTPHHAAAVSAPPSRTPSVGPVSPGPGAALFHENLAADPASDSSSVTTAPRSPALLHSPLQEDFESSRAARLSRRRSTGHATEHRSVTPSRASSRQGREVTQSGQSVTRSKSTHSTRGRAIPNYDVSIAEEPVPRIPSRTENRNSLVRRSLSHTGEPLDPVCNMRRNSTIPQPEFAPPARTQSETALYPPHRRRSLVLTPGVATRSAEPRKTLRKKADFRKTMHPLPTHSRQNSIDSITTKRLSMPALPVDFEPRQRSSTPTEVKYLQLGGMKFGSLVITNGSPQPTPGLELDSDVLNGPTTSSTPDQTHGVVEGQSFQSRQPHASDANSAAKSPEWITIPTGQQFGPGDAANPVSPTDAHYDALCRLTAPASPVAARSPTPELQITSRHAAVDDHLFDEDDTLTRFESPEIVSHVIEVAEKLDMGMKSPIRPSLVHVTRKDSGYVSNNSTLSRKSLSGADSGYGSSASLAATHRLKLRRRTTDGSDYLTIKNINAGSNGTSPSAEPSSNAPTPLSMDDSVTPPEDSTQPSISSRDEGSVSTPRTSTSSAPRSLIRLPSLKSSKTREAKQSKKSSNPDSPSSRASFLQRVTSSNKVHQSGDGTSTQPTSQPRMSSLRRLLSTKSKKNLATSYAVHDIDDSVPAVPTAVEAMLHEHNQEFPTAPKRLALRVEASQASLGTIMSMDDPGETTVPESKAAVAPLPSSPPKTRQANEAPMPERRTSHRLSISSVSTSILSPKSTPKRALLKRRSTVDERTRRSLHGISLDDDSDDDVVIDTNLVDDTNFMIHRSRRSVGNSPFDQAMFASSENGRYPKPDGQSWLDRPYVDPNAPRRQQQLRSRKSAPDVRQTAAGHLSPVFESQALRTSKTPPPISLQTRGSKKKRGGHKPQRRQTSPGPATFNRRPMPYDPYESTAGAAMTSDSLGHYPSAAAAAGPQPRAPPRPRSMTQQGPYPMPIMPANPKMKRPLFGQRMSFDGYGYQQPRPYQQQQQQQANLAPMPSRVQNENHWKPNRHMGSRTSSTDSLTSLDGPMLVPGSGQSHGEKGNAPFRVLHSYNSPAYKGIPIWG